MKSATSWSVKGIEPQVREAAKLAARKSGQTLGQWLNAMILDTADGEPDFHDDSYQVPHRTAARPGETPYQDRIRHLEQELAQLTRQQTDTAMHKRYGAGAIVDPQATPLQHVIERLDRNEHDTARGFEALHERLSALSRELTETRSETAEKLAETVHGGEHEVFESALRNVVDHIESADKENRDILSDLNARLDDLTRQVADAPATPDTANRKILSDVEHRLTALAHRVDQIDQDGNRELKQDVENRLRQLTLQVEQVASSASGEMPAEINERLAELAHRVEVAERIASQTQDELHQSIETRMGQFNDRLDALRESSKQTAEKAATAALRSAQKDFREIESQVRDLTKKVQDAGGLDPQTERTISDLMQQMSHMSQDVQQIKVESATENDVQSLRSALDNLHNMTEQRFADATNDKAFAELEHRLSEVSQRLEHTIASPQPDPQVENLERRVHELDARLAASQGDASTEDLIQALGSQIDALSQRVANSEQQHSGVQAIEKSIAQLFESVEQTRNMAAQAAEQAARGGGGAGDDKTLTALQKGLHALKASAESADQRNQETLEAVHDTLEKVITRLVALEEGSDGEPSQSAPASLAGMKQGTPPGGNDLADLNLPPIPPLPNPKFSGDTDDVGTEPAWKDAVTQKSAEQMEELFGGDGTEPRPLPGDTLPETDTPKPSESETPGDSASRRNDFIAAARRAAQAAAETPEEDTASGPFKALRRGRRGRKTAQDDGKKSSKRRPLILAAIVLLMIGAASAYKLMSSKGTAPEAAHITAPPATKVSPPAVDVPDETKTPKPDKQSRAEPPADKTTTVSPHPAAADISNADQTTADPDRQTSTLPKDPDLPMSPGSDPLTTGAIDRIEKSPASADKQTPDPMMLSLPGLVPPSTVQPAEKTAAPKQTTLQEKPVQEDPAADTTQTAKAPPAQTVDPRKLPPAGIGPIGMRVAAATGDPVAQFMVAAAYTEGKTVKQDFRLAAQWYQKSAARGLAPAQYRLATFYEKGKGVPQDIAAARIWYERAAEKGNRKAMHNLAVLYADGSHGSPDFAKAGIWFRNAAELGLKDSQYNLGILHERGLGVAKDLSQAYKWFALAARQGDRDADTRVRRLENQLAPQALIQAKLDVENWSVKATDQTANVVTPPADGWKSAENRLSSQSYATREMVAEAQTLLNTLGYDAGPSDGLMGDRTRDAVRHFQKANDMLLTGAIDARLLKELRHKAG